MYMSITFDRWEKMRLIYLIVCLCMHPDISDIPPTLDYIIDFLFLDIINFPKVIKIFSPERVLFDLGWVILLYQEPMLWSIKLCMTLTLYMRLDEFYQMNSVTSKRVISFRFKHNYLCVCVCVIGSDHYDLSTFPIA